MYVCMHVCMYVCMCVYYTGGSAVFGERSDRFGEAVCLVVLVKYPLCMYVCMCVSMYVCIMQGILLFLGSALTALVRLFDLSYSSSMCVYMYTYV
jgi:hypothetical protein